MLAYMSSSPHQGDSAKLDQITGMCNHMMLRMWLYIKFCSLPWSGPAVSHGSWESSPQEERWHPMSLYPSWFLWQLLPSHYLIWLFDPHEFGLWNRLADLWSETSRPYPHCILLQGPWANRCCTLYHTIIKHYCTLWPSGCCSLAECFCLDLCTGDLGFQMFAAAHAVLCRTPVHLNLFGVSMV